MSIRPRAQHPYARLSFRPASAPVTLDRHPIKQGAVGADKIDRLRAKRQMSQAIAFNVKMIHSAYNVDYIAAYFRRTLIDQFTYT